MKQKPSLYKYAVTVTVSGIDREADPDFLQDFRHGVVMRDHLTLLDIIFLEPVERLVAKVLVKATAEERAGRGVADELFEISNAMLRNIDGVSIHVESVEPVED